MEVQIFPAGGVLHAHGDGDLCGLDRTLAQHRKFLQYDLQLRIGLHQLEHVRHRALAVAAIVVEELDEGDVAILVADGHTARRVENGLGILCDRRLVLFGFGGGLALRQLVHCLFQHFRMRDQIVADDLLDVAALHVGEVLCRCRLRRRAQGEGDQGGGEQAEGGHLLILFQKSARGPSIPCYPIRTNASEVYG